MQPNTDKAPTMLAASKIKERDGWTDAAIKRFLGSPDATKKNPFYASAAPMKLYLQTKVEAVERMDSFTDFKKMSRKRRASALLVAERKKDETLLWARTIKIQLVSRLTLHEVKKRAVRDYNAHCEEKEMRGMEVQSRASLDSDPSFVDRITVNYLRHALSNYEDILFAKTGSFGTHEAYAIIKARVLDAIAKAYPPLASEVERQSKVDPLLPPE